jgi:predicted NBD/HSP70 family sugar kinase
LKLTGPELKILKKIGLNNGISRKELSKITGLSQAGITIISKSLIQNSYIVEGERVSNGLGRKEVMLYSNPDKFLFIGVDIGGYRVRLALSNNSLTVLHSTEFLITDGQLEPSKEKFIAEQIRNFLNKIGYSASSVDAIGIGVTGIIDNTRQIILNIPNVEHWDNLNISLTLQEEFACPVFLDEGGRTLALAEKFMGKAKLEEDFIIVHCAYGVVAGIMTNGQILRGAHNVGGLLGHNTADPNGLRCSCGNYGCLENIVTYPMLEKDFLANSSRGLSLKEAYSQNDKNAIDVCISAGQALGIALSNVVNLFNPVSIYLGGPMFDDYPILFEETKRTITLRANRFATISLRLERSTFNHEQGIYGALLLAKTNFLFGN